MYKLVYPALMKTKACLMLRFAQLQNVIPNVYDSVPGNLIDRLDHLYHPVVPAALSLPFSSLLA
jgi:hypothetical protein